MSDNTDRRCACCGKRVTVMAELAGGPVYCGSLCRRGRCGHNGSEGRRALVDLLDRLDHRLAPLPPYVERHP